MYQNQFDALLQKPLPFKSFMLYGEGEYFLDKYAKLIQEKINPDTTLKLYDEDYDFTQAKALLSQGSLFGQSNLFIYKGVKSLPKDDVKSLLSIAQKNENSYFIFLLQSEKKSPLSALFNEKIAAVEVRFFQPGLPQATAELQQAAKALNVQIDRYGLEHLYLLLNGDLSLCRNELQKLSILQTPVTTKDIDNLVYSTNSIKVESLFYDLMDKKPVIEHLTQLLQSGEDSFKLLRQIQYFFQQLFMFRSFIALKGHVDSKEILGYKLPKNIEEKKASYAQKLKILQYKELFQKLIDAELELKKADSMQKEPVLIATILSLQSFMH
jgi:DNA polymerase-3 subunit delta